MDIQLHYVEKGSGPPLLLLHGNGENSDYFCHQIDYFQETFHVYAPDTRGHGKSPRGAAPFTLEQFALDLKDFMDEKRDRESGYPGLFRRGQHRPSFCTEESGPGPPPDSQRRGSLSQRGETFSTDPDYNRLWNRFLPFSIQQKSDPQKRNAGPYGYPAVHCPGRAVLP